MRLRGGRRRVGTVLVALLMAQAGCAEGRRQSASVPQENWACRQLEEAQRQTDAGHGTRGDGGTVLTALAAWPVLVGVCLISRS